ncbi:MAG: flagellar type III secretion system pore protein FliP [Alphaproteobacteria bacterium]|nr:flagellar type III secretion system pore protein FliP [Alphaproteobacteria bacterium]OJV46339.1 MAG: flagellar biosynthetic protein FliP [Alphaproteobacteria bacterium 43-37]
MSTTAGLQIKTFGKALVLFSCIIVALIIPVESLGFSIDFDSEAPSNTTRFLQLIAVFTVLSVAPSLLIMVTSFTRLVVVLSFLRNALGMQQSPPNPVLISLALFMTFFIMSPVLEKSYTDGIAPYTEGSISGEEAWKKSTAPFHGFMSKHAREKDIKLFLDLSGRPAPAEAKDIPLTTLIPAFMISELRRAFEIGFLLFIPFLIIDLVVASVLMSMGMMMVPPIMIALPFKVIFFVLVDGWHLVVGSLVKGFS